MMKKVFIDGSVGTTGLRIYERLSSRTDLTLLTLPEDKRKDPIARAEMLNSVDVAFLCLPDDAAREAVAMLENPSVTVIDASTAHRTRDDWAYGFPELGKAFEEKLLGSKRIAVPGCHASGFIALVYPLVANGLISADTLLSAHSITGYSGGGKKMIAEYESEERCPLLDAPRQYGIAQTHKHIPEMVKITGLQNAPVFSPIVADFYSGMEVSVPLHAAQINGTVDDIKAVYKNLYNGEIVKYAESADESGFLSAVALGGKDGMQIEVHGNNDRVLLTARYDNLGKGASGAAIECMNLVIGAKRTEGLVL
ncbi:MAG: N-acetyl-gamma-glutamyl-phosphate reductase [Clostridia bacterium]|nr:N-acetyl-gamma-glutamyl-phosphate reductase [Clostridia bacterium]